MVCSWGEAPDCRTDTDLLGAGSLVIRLAGSHISTWRYLGHWVTVSVRSSVSEGSRPFNMHLKNPGIPAPCYLLLSLTFSVPPTQTSTSSTRHWDHWGGESSQWCPEHSPANHSLCSAGASLSNHPRKWFISTLGRLWSALWGHRSWWPSLGFLGQLTSVNRFLSPGRWVGLRHRQVMEPPALFS